MDLKKLSDFELETELKSAVREENLAQTKVLHLLDEAERRRLYSKEYSSLHAYCVKTLKYTEGAAQRRVDTMRAMKLIPEIEIKILSGELNLSSVAQAQTFFRHEKKSGKPYSLDQKIGLLAKLENKSTRECIQTLVAISPNSIPQEKRRVLTKDKTELKVVLDEVVLEKLDKLKALMSHKNPNMTDSELINELADIALKKFDPALKPIKAKKENKKPENLNAPPPPAPEVRTQNDIPNSNMSISRYIPQQLKIFVWQRDKGKCTYPKCESRYFLEYDHISPIVLGGKTCAENLRLLCKAHNQRAAINSFGFKHMNKFINA
ncbi:MAG: HNH endonuclease signature motif containing protein [Oligoflexia bacterium]|nr:HNH endonuclease signature motif containing protein [Oligoflexia bacterium]